MISPTSFLKGIYWLTVPSNDVSHFLSLHLVYSQLKNKITVAEAQLCSGKFAHSTNLKLYLHLSKNSIQKQRAAQKEKRNNKIQSNGPSLESTLY